MVRSAEHRRKLAETQRRKGRRQECQRFLCALLCAFASLREPDVGTTMDAHTLELLEFAKVRELLAAYASSSLGKDLATQLEPSTDIENLRLNLALVTEMAEAIGEGRTP